MKTWTDKDFDRLKELAATGMFASAIAKELSTSHASIGTRAGRHGITVEKYTPAEKHAMSDRRAAKLKRKYAARRARRKAAARAGVPAVVIDPCASRTSPIYRNRLPRIPQMSKSELRAMLTQAVRNTAEASV